MRPRRAIAFFFLMALSLRAQVPPGAIATVAGAGSYGYSGEAGQATGAQLDTVYALAVDVLGNLYIADSWNHCVRKVALNGVITLVAGSRNRWSSGSRATDTQLLYPRGLAVDERGNLFIADSGNSVVRKVTPDGNIATVAGSDTAGFSGDGGRATSARLRFPRGLALDAKGNLYLADSWNFRVRKVTPQGTISTVAGSGLSGNSGDGGPATDARLGLIQSLALDEQGNLYLADIYNHCVRKVSPDGLISTVAAQLRFPRGLAVDAQNNLYIADAFNHRIRKLEPNGAISTVAGTGSAGYSGDRGPATSASFNCPYALAADPRGNVFVADLRNYRVRKARFETMTQAPAIAAGRVVNAASWVTPVAPGSLISISGQWFSYKPYSAGSLPSPVTLGGTTVTVGGTAIPLMYVSATQINAQLPRGLPPGAASMKVNFGGVESEAAGFQVASAAPGIFAWGGGRGVILNQDYSLNSPENPASRGSTVIVYATGQGAVTPAVGDGLAAAANPLSRTTSAPAVIIGGAWAQVAFSGLAPGFVGLWQVNAVIPPDAPSGSEVPLLIGMSGAASNQVSLSIR